MTGDSRPRQVIGDMLGHYRVIERIGGGAMGEVFLAEDSKLGRRVALKVLPSESVIDEKRLERFRAEARAVAALNHPNIVTIFGVEEVEGVHFLVMELVQGATLQEVIPLGGLPFDEFLRIAAELTQAVAAAHAAGITHRDLKPDNVMITQSGRVKVLDFGLAKRVDEPRSLGGTSGMPVEASQQPSDRLTRDGEMLGTVPYMSPEHVMGRIIDTRSDLFSLGIILYEMLTGQRPFKGRSSAAVLTSILSDNPRPVSSERRDVPEHLACAIALCLEKDPAERLQSAESLYEQLRILRRQRSSGGASASVALKARMSVPRRSVAHVAALARQLSRRDRMPLLVLAAVFAVNLFETIAETELRTRHGVGRELGFQLARAAHWFEGTISVEGWDAAPRSVIYGYSIAYFFVILVLLVVTGWTLTRMRDPRPFRLFALAVAVDYAISLPFFLFFPVPERWAWPDSGAILLSDLWAPRLIEIFRPISALDNCFPSFHVSLTVLAVGLCFSQRLRYRWVALWMGLLVILSTLVLGIHWTTDVVAGFATGILALALAPRLDGWIPWPGWRRFPGAPGAKGTEGLIEAPESRA